SGSSGYRITLDLATGTIALYQRLFQHLDRLIQERPLSLSAAGWHKLKVVMQDKFLDAYVDDELWLVRADRTFEDGCFVLHARGEVAVRNLSACEYLGPEKLMEQGWTRRSEPRHLFSR